MQALDRDEPFAIFGANWMSENAGDIERLGRSIAGALASSEWRVASGE